MLDILQMGLWRSDATMLMVPAEGEYTFSATY